MKYIFHDFSQIRFISSKQIYLFYRNMLYYIDWCIHVNRAVYQDADLYLLDDPLSALDSKVGNQVFNMWGLNILCYHHKHKTLLYK